MLLEQTTTVDAAEAFDRVEVGVFPVGSVEQHGPALPLSTDTRAARVVAESVAERDDTVVGPTIPVGVSPHHRQFHGSLWVSTGTLVAYLSELIESVTDHGVEKVVLVNGHGGNRCAIEEVAGDLYRRERAFVVPWNWWEGVGDVASEVLGENVEVPGHAADFEASMMLYAAEDLVRTDRFEDATPGRFADSRFDHPAVRGHDFVDWSEDGLHGELDRASAEAGQALFRAARDALQELIDWVADLPAEDCRPRRHQ